MAQLRRLSLILFAALAFSQPAFALQGNWDRCVENVLTWEGGWTGPRIQEPGGYAMRGVSYTTFKKWRAQQGKPVPSPEDLHSISLDETKQIYATLYGDVIKFNDLPAGYDCASLHSAIMFGPGQGTDERPGWARLNADAQGDYSMLVALMMRAKMYRPDCGPTKNAQTGKPMWLCRGWADRFVSVLKISKEIHDAAVQP